MLPVIFNSDNLSYLCTKPMMGKFLMFETIKRRIIKFFIANKRELPFRMESNAYHIWLSEIIMQQTRIEQGTPYFIRLSEAFPTIEALATADEELLLRYWQGLGYYSRARNLHATAKALVADYGGKLPESFAELRRLKGIGDYTAAAIASIAFGEPVPVIDGNVMRVVARLFAIPVPVNTTAGKKAVAEHLQKIFSAEQPGLFNEAIMEFGALQCVPANPNCKECLLNEYCEAWKMDEAARFPVKLPPRRVTERHLNYLVLLMGGRRSTVMRQRNDKDIWKRLYEFPLVETEAMTDDATLCSHQFWEAAEVLPEPACFESVTRIQHKLSHRLLKVTFTVACLKEEIPFSLPEDSIAMSWTEAVQRPKPVLLANFMERFFSETALPTPDGRSEPEIFGLKEI